MAPMPMLSEKNDWPRAARMLEPVSLLKSGLKRNANPSLAPAPSVSERTLMRMSRINSMGIRILDTFSMPFCTPITMTEAVRMRKNA